MGSKYIIELQQQLSTCWWSIPFNVWPLIFVRSEWIHEQANASDEKKLSHCYHETYIRISQTWTLSLKSKWTNVHLVLPWFYVDLTSAWTLSLKSKPPMYTLLWFLDFMSAWTLCLKSITTYVVMVLELTSAWILSNVHQCCHGFNVTLLNLKCKCTST